VQLGLDPSKPAPVAEQFRTLADKGGTAMIVIRDFLTAALGDDICKAGLAGRIAVIGEYGDIALAGALFSYGADLGDLFRRAAGYVDRILKGAKPADLPIQLPTKFELTMNLKTARTLGLTIPPSLLVLADHIIE
jgi:putative ABC transport system substrate-binding protein